MAYFRRLIHNTDYRRELVNWSLGLVGAGWFIGYQFANGSMITYVKDFAHFYKDGKPIKLDPHVETLAAIALNEAKISRKEKARVDFFPVFGDDMFHWGTSAYIKGCLIGVPYNFTFKDKSDVNPSEIMVFNQTNIPWDSKAGRMLLDGLVLSDSAKKFALLRGIYLTNNYLPMLAPIPAFVAIVFGRSMSLWLVDNPAFKSNFPFFGRIVVHLIVTVVSFITYARMRDSLNDYYEFNADKRTITTFTGSNAKSSGVDDSDAKSSDAQNSGAKNSNTGSEGKKEGKEPERLYKSQTMREAMAMNFKMKESSPNQSLTDLSVKRESFNESPNVAPSNTEYYEGGIEYYSKQLQKNKAYRRLLGKEGPKYFTRDGDEVWTLTNWFLKPKPVPITERLRAIQETMDFHQKDADSKS